MTSSSLPAASQPAVAIVSGGSRGLGLGIVEHLLAKGCKVATFARSSTPAMARLTDAHPNDFYFEPVDAADAAAVQKFVSSVRAKLGPVSMLVNNAAVGQDHLLSHMPLDKIEQLLAINLLGPIVLTKAVVRAMLVGSQGGRIVNISSICGQRGYPGLAVYSATKAGLDGFTRSLAREVGARNILVNSIAPGFFLSEMSSVLAPEQTASIVRRTPTGKLVDEHNVLPVLDMLLFSDHNMTGQTVVVDGGSIQ